MAVPLTTIVSDPDWIPHALDAGGGNLTFVRVPRDDRAALTFLSDEHYKGQFPQEAFPLPPVAGTLDGIEQAPLHFIFHTSFCCSTLLAKALEVPGRAMSLKEPEVLLHLANRFARVEDEAERKRLDITLRLLARPYAEGETIIVKPSNFANRLLAPALVRDQRTRAVLLYSDLPTLLRSLAKTAIWGRIFGRQLYRNLAAWSWLNLGYGPVETFDQTDLQITALAWLMHIHHFNEVARQSGPERVMLLNSADFLDSVPETLGGVSRFLGVDLDQATIADIARGPVFSAHSKLPGAYSAEEREREHAAVEAAHGEEIAMVLKWLAAVAAHAGVPIQPALLGA
jgi:hypothetical protein